MSVTVAERRMNSPKKNQNGFTFKGALQTSHSEPRTAAFGRRIGSDFSHIGGKCPRSGHPSPPTLTEIIVTAQKREENIQDVPISVIALSGQQLQDAGVKDIKNLTGSDPGPHRDFHHLGELDHRAHPRHRHGRRQSGPGILRRRGDRWGLSAAQRRRLWRSRRNRPDRGARRPAGRTVRQEQ